MPSSISFRAEPRGSVCWSGLLWGLDRR
jgi:hypothetical protein